MKHLNKKLFFFAKNTFQLWSAELIFSQAHFVVFYSREKEKKPVG